MFTYADGRPIRSEYLTRRFRELSKELDLPPIRLHGTRTRNPRIKRSADPVPDWPTACLPW
jgi:hypothetical protein